MHAAYAHTVQLVTHREKLKLELRCFDEVLRRNDRSQRRDEVNQLLAALRDATFSVVFAIDNLGDFQWEGRDYLATMANDLDFVADSISLVSAIGISPELLRNNPLMLPRTLARAAAETTTTSEKVGDRDGDEHQRLRYAEALLVAAMNRANPDTRPPPPLPATWSTRARAQLAEMRRTGATSEAFDLKSLHHKAHQSKPRPEQAYAQAAAVRARVVPQSIRRTGLPPVAKPVVEENVTQISRMRVLAEPRVAKPVVATREKKPTKRRRRVIREDDLLVLATAAEPPSDAAARIGAAVLALIADEMPSDTPSAWPRVVERLASSRQAAKDASDRIRGLEPRAVSRVKARALARLLHGAHPSVEDADLASALSHLAKWASCVVRACLDLSAKSPPYTTGLEKKKNSGRQKSSKSDDDDDDDDDDEETCHDHRRQEDPTSKILQTTWWRFDEADGPPCLVTVIGAVVDRGEHLVVKAYEPSASAESQLSLDPTAVRRLRGHTPLHTFVKTDLLAHLELVKGIGGCRRLRTRSGPPGGCCVQAPGIKPPPPPKRKQLVSATDSVTLRRTTSPANSSSQSSEPIDQQSRKTKGLSKKNKRASAALNAEPARRRYDLSAKIARHQLSAPRNSSPQMNAANEQTRQESIVFENLPDVANVRDALPSILPRPGDSPALDDSKKSSSRTHHHHHHHHQFLQESNHQIRKRPAVSPRNQGGTPPREGNVLLEQDVPSRRNVVDQQIPKKKKKKESLEKTGSHESQVEEDVLDKRRAKSTNDEEERNEGMVPGTPAYARQPKEMIVPADKPLARTTDALAPSMRFEESATPKELAASRPPILFDDVNENTRDSKINEEDDDEDRHPCDDFFLGNVNARIGSCDSGSTHKGFSSQAPPPLKEKLVALESSERQTVKQESCCCCCCFSGEQPDVIHSLATSHAKVAAAQSSETRAIDKEPPSIVAAAAAAPLRKEQQKQQNVTGKGAPPPCDSAVDADRATNQEQEVRSGGDDAEGSHNNDEDYDEDYDDDDFDDFFEDEEKREDETVVEKKI